MTRTHTTKGRSRRGAVRRPRNEIELVLLSPFERQEYRLALRVTEYMRDGLSYTAACRKAGIDPRRASQWIEPALVKKGRRWAVKPTDRLPRLMRVLGLGGVEHDLYVPSSRTASRIAQHWSAVGHFLETGDTTGLEALEGEVVAGITLLTDPDAIEEWERRGELHVPDVYSLIT